MIVITLFCGFWGFLNIEHRGYLINILIVSSILLSSFSGYYSTKFYKIMGGSNWLINIISTALLLPCVLLSIILIAFTGFYFENSGVSLYKC